MVDIHARYVTWFFWGFIQTLVIPCGGGILTGLAMLINPSLGAGFSGLAGCANACGTLAWWITGIVWRFRSDGAFAAGDDVPEGKTIEEWETEITLDGSLYQYKSGKFMFFYYVICWAIIGGGCVGSILASICSCFGEK